MGMDRIAVCHGTGGVALQRSAPLRPAVTSAATGVSGAWHSGTLQVESSPSVCAVGDLLGISVLAGIPGGSQEYERWDFRTSESGIVGLREGQHPAGCRGRVPQGADARIVNG